MAFYGQGGREHHAGDRWPDVGTPGLLFPGTNTDVTVENARVSMPLYSQCRDGIHTHRS